MNIGRLTLCYNNENQDEGIHLEDRGLVADKDTLLKVIKGLQFTYENVTDEEIAKINENKEEFMSEEMRRVYTNKREFKRSKNRSKSWVFRCPACETKVDDAVFDYYWFRDDINLPFCSEECAQNYVGNKDRGSNKIIISKNGQRF